MPIQFPPTYKYEIGTDHYKISKNVYPSFTDRIFFDINSEFNSLVPIHYSCDGDMKISDHKPVFAQFELVSKDSV